MVNLEQYSNDWCKTNNEILRKKGKKQRVVPMSYYFDDIPKDLDESKSIGVYSDRLKRAIDVVTKCTGSRVNVIAHSMGGLVVREYIGKFGGSKVNKLIMLGTPNDGIWDNDLVSGPKMCEAGHKGEECNDMTHNSTFLISLNNHDITSDNVKYYTISGKSNSILAWINSLKSGKSSDGVIRMESVYLNGAKNYPTVKCSHNNLILPDNCPKAYEYILDALQD